jgi:hypothetical protein
MEYRYRRLKPNQTRFLTLELLEGVDGSHDVLIQCSLRSADLDSIGKYHTLSYALRAWYIYALPRRFFTADANATHSALQPS